VEYYRQEVLHLPPTLQIVSNSWLRFFFLFTSILLLNRLWWWFKFLHILPLSRLVEKWRTFNIKLRLRNINNSKIFKRPNYLETTQHWHYWCTFESIFTWMLIGIYLEFIKGWRDICICVWGFDIVCSFKCILVLRRRRNFGKQKT
jgi:hypothetical protein